MRDKKVIDEMVSLAERFGQKIEFDEFDGRGGWCRVKGSDRVIINERLTPREQIRILAQVLAGYPIEEQAMPPKVRQIIEDAKAEQLPEPEPEPMPEPQKLEEPEPAEGPAEPTAEEPAQTPQPIPMPEPGPGPVQGTTSGQMPSGTSAEEAVLGEAAETDAKRADQERGEEGAPG